MVNETRYGVVRDSGMAIVRELEKGVSVDNSVNKIKGQLKVLDNKKAIALKQVEINYSKDKALALKQAETELESKKAGYEREMIKRQNSAKTQLENYLKEVEKETAELKQNIVDIAFDTKAICERQILVATQEFQKEVSALDNIEKTISLEKEKVEQDFATQKIELENDLLNVETQQKSKDKISQTLERIFTSMIDVAKATESTK